MKLKYYLRGLGIGMIVTALILGISFSNRQDQTSQIMTDDQIRERAAELGMVDSSELTLAALQNSAKQPTEGTPEETTQTQEQNNIEAEPETTVPAETQATVEPETTDGSMRPDWWRMQRHLTIIYATTATAAVSIPAHMRSLPGLPKRKLLK